MTTNKNQIIRLASILKDSKKIVFFGGAGVSTESNIPDFRSADGLYKQKYDFPPETILSHDFFVSNPEYFYQFYKEKMIYEEAKPNKAHYVLNKLEQMGKLKSIVTQNIDNLHQMAGSKKVLELHGSVYRNYCLNCHKFYPLEEVIKQNGVPHCSCGGIIKPDVVLYQEKLNMEVIGEAINDISTCDTLIVGGTSLIVYPAASFINYFLGDHLVIINKTATDYDYKAELVIKDSIGKVLDEAYKLFINELEEK